MTDLEYTLITQAFNHAISASVADSDRLSVCAQAIAYRMNHNNPDFNVDDFLGACSLGGKFK